jgi:hypothetical protein
MPPYFAAPLPSLSPSPVNSADLGVTASSFASFAEIMTGFSFAALVIYLAYESGNGRHRAIETTSAPKKSGRNPRDTKGDDNKQLPPLQVGMEHPIRRTEVAATLFYSTASLAISSFLYASLTIQVEAVPKVTAALLLYGVIFGLSVLAFFYALTLMTYENRDARGAARAAYLVVVIAGPAVVLRFLADVAQGAWDFRCSGACSPESWSPPLIGGIAILVCLLVISIVISLLRIFEKCEALRGICNWLCVRPVLPAWGIFIISVGVTLLGIAVTEPVSFVPSEGFIWIILVVGSSLLALFALACGCVVGPRLNKSSDTKSGQNDRDAMSAVLEDHS